MENRESNKRWFRALATLVIWLAMTGLWAGIWYWRFADTLEIPFFRRGNWMVVAIYGALLYIVTHFYGGYRVGYYQRGGVIFSGMISMVITNVITYLQVSLIERTLIKRGWEGVVPFLWLCAGDFILIWIWATAATKLYMKIHPPRHLLLVYGGNAMAQSLVAKMIERDDKYLIQESVNIEEGLTAVLDKVEHYHSVIICDVKSGHRNRLLKYCYARNIRVYMTPKISDILIRGAGEINLFDTPLLLSRPEGISLEQRIIKRAMDLAASVLGLVLASPFLLLVAIAIKLEDGGPVLYSQVRLTEGGREFLLYKFRSMRVDAEKDTGAVLAGKKDERITDVGGVIRRLRLDELPQLVNILKGDMSLVGPRPERPEKAAEYRETMEEFDLRLKVKAGLTGYAQVMGKYNTTPYDKLKLDLMYITGYSVMLDVKLILQTVKTVFMRESTEGVEISLKNKP